MNFNKIKITFITLGCRVNQYETRYWIGRLPKDFEIVDLNQNPDFVVLNSCVVTKNADRDTRKLLHKIKRNNPSAKLILTGCYARLHKEETYSVEKDIILIDSYDFKQTSNLLEKLIQNETKKIFNFGSQDIFSHSKFMPSSNRPPLLIQTGCNKRCAYCIIPYVRGNSHSFSEKEILSEYENMMKKGYAETVLTGINLGSWGLDFKPKKRFEHLLKQLLSITPKGSRIRIGSIEPEYVTDKIVEMFTSSLLAPHIHLPLQGGTDFVLKSMRRPNTTAFYKDLIHKLKSINPDIAIGVDIIAGFPSETEKDHLQTLEFLESLPISYLHVFPYSKREGTPAASMKQLAHNIIKQRSANLRKIHNRKHTEYLMNFLNKTEYVVWERNFDDNYFGGMAGGFFQTKISGQIQNFEQNKLIKVKITSIKNEIVEGVKQNAKSL